MLVCVCRDDMEKKKDGISPIDGNVKELRGHKECDIEEAEDYQDFVAA